MPDTFTDQLSRLAPTVDAAAGRKIFERARSGGSPTPRRWLAAAVVVLLVAGVVGVWAVARDGGDDTAPAAPVGDDESELLAVFESGQPVGTILVASDQATFEQHLADVGRDLPGADVDFDDTLVVMFGVGGSSCPFVVDGFDVAGNVWTARVVVDGEECDDIGLMWTSVVAFDRAELAATAVDGEVVLRVAASDEDQATVVVDLDAPDAVFEVRLVEQTDEPFGELAAFDSAAELDAYWAPADLETSVDWDRHVVLLATMPDNACPDTLVRFDADGTVWTPVFEEQAPACEDPLLSWLYVVAVERSALGDEVTFRLPADDVYDLPERSTTISVTSGAGAPSGPDTVGLEPTGVVVPMPEVGVPTLHNTSIGLTWVVAHDDRTVSVLPATIEQETGGDEGGVAPLRHLVLVADDGESFVAGSFVWDAHGRAVNRGRANDLVGLEGRVSGGEVELLVSDATRIAGDPAPPANLEANHMATTMAELQRIFGAPIDTMTFLTLSSTGPIWRYLDATLVVEDGVGRICEVPDDGPVPDLATCADAEIVFDTRVTSTEPGVTAWYFAPILAFQDPFEGFTTVVPLGGSSARNDAADGFVPVPSITVVESGSIVPMRITTESEAAELPQLDDVDLGEIAWDEVHLVILTIQDDDCPIAVTGLSSMGDNRWTVEAQPEGTSCRLPLTHWLNVIAIPRSALPSGAIIDFEGATVIWP